MSGPYVGICSDWATTDDVCHPCAGVDFDSGVMAEKLTVASEILFELSGRRWPGICSDFVRPCVRRIGEDYRGGDGLFHIACRCGPAERCGCSRLSLVDLGAYPIVSVDLVRIDGETLDAARYRVDDYRWLVRLADADGTNPGWPCAQRLDLPVTEPDTFEVHFTYGSMPPSAGVTAAARLACELTLACDPASADTCQLSKRVQTVVRQGVTVVLDTLDALDRDRFGIMEIDAFLQAYNPSRTRRRARVLSPDVGPSVRRAGT